VSAGQSRTEHTEERGRGATHPRDIPKRGWRDILLRVRREISNDHVSLISAGMAMYALLAVFPGLAAAIAIYGLFASPEDVLRHMQAFSGVLPQGAWEVLSQRLQEIAGRERATLNIGLVLSLLIALWGARSGMAALMTAMNIAYSEKEQRGLLLQIAISLLLTLGAILGFLLVLLLGVAVPIALKALGTSTWVQAIVAVLRWSLLWLVVVLGLSIVYRYGPDRERARWRWVSWGSAIAATLWLIGSLLFALYVQVFASYGKTYGAIGSVVILLLWFYHSSFIVVLGAEINAEMERQTRRDTTTGPEAPLGERDAYAADTVGPTP
jgi:membrane protein